MARKAGEWNQVGIVAHGNHVEHWMNGEKIVEYELRSEDWKQRVAASKFKDLPHYGLADMGHIVLQDHSDTGLVPEHQDQKAGLNRLSGHEEERMR